MGVAYTSQHKPRPLYIQATPAIVVGAGQEAPMITKLAVTPPLPHPPPRAHHTEIMTQQPASRPGAAAT
jgi:hypothetical protein